ncbi:MAG: vitamin K epoxide reductase family protein [Nanoarchaeota archaeon]|nr:vitamin K epoxide reductase family protein [Nanoarchaeota archaeon]
MFNAFISIISILGALFSVYAFKVELKSSRHENYKAVCDIHEKMSCTKAFTSPYGSIFGISNSLMGLYFYSLIFVLSFFSQFKAIFYLSILAVIVSIYLAYILFIKMKNFCIVCASIDIINVILLIVSYIIVY